MQSRSDILTHVKWDIFLYHFHQHEIWLEFDDIRLTEKEIWLRSIHKDPDFFPGTLNLTIQACNILLGITVPLR